MSEAEARITVGVLSIPENRLRKAVHWIQNTVCGTRTIENTMNDMGGHVCAMTEIMHIIVADISGKWPADKRERVQKQIANFSRVISGLSKIRPQGNPFTAQELQRLQGYTVQAQNGSTFTAEQASEFRALSERASREYAGQDWVADLLKIALFIFALYAIAGILDSPD